ncbi:MAG: NAD(P)H-binding protein [Bacteroidetes bacterium]|nr:MAG: NAD(P)H-binding protein [Bacteroidota bacterium]
MNNRILVLGSNGKTGKRVYAGLTEKGATVTPASRSSAVPFDWYNESTWQRALTGHDSVYITFQPDLAIPQSTDIITRFVASAKKADVKKLVLLSGRGESESIACENIVRNSGLKNTIVRASFFMQNFSEGFWLDSILSGEFVIPIVKAKEPFVDADDIAEVVTEALVSDTLNNKIIEVTGSELLSFKEVIDKIAAALKKEIKLVEVETDEYAALLRSFQMPEDYVSLIIYLFTEVFDGRNESVRMDSEIILKRNATSFNQFINNTIAAGLWS